MYIIKKKLKNKSVKENKMNDKKDLDKVANVKPQYLVLDEERINIFM
jgi:hypothetical protein